MDIVGGAVQRIDDPRRRCVCAGTTLRGFALFTQKAVIPVATDQVFSNGLLRGDVRLRHQIEASLLANLNPPPPILQYRGPAPGRLTGRIEIVFQELAHDGLPRRSTEQFLLRRSKHKAGPVSKQPGRSLSRSDAMEPPLFSLALLQLPGS